jgi:phage regulator Rha-like protein
MTPEDRRIRATDARQLLEHPMFVEAWNAMEKHLQMQAITCDSDNAQKALRIVISQQLLAGVKREIQRLIEDGFVANEQIKLYELEQKRKFAMFRR